MAMQATRKGLKADVVDVNGEIARCPADAIEGEIDAANLPKAAPGTTTTRKAGIIIPSGDFKVDKTSGVMSLTTKIPAFTGAEAGYVLTVSSDGKSIEWQPIPTPEAPISEAE